MVYNPGFWDNHHSQVEFFLKSVLDHCEYIGKYSEKWKFFKILPDGVQSWLSGQ